MSINVNTVPIEIRQSFAIPIAQLAELFPEHKKGIANVCAAVAENLSPKTARVRIMGKKEAAKVPAAEKPENFPPLLFDKVASLAIRAAEMAPAHVEGIAECLVRIAEVIGTVDSSPITSAKKRKAVAK